MAMKIGNVTLPDIPEEVKAQYPYLIIVKTNTEDSVIYSLFGSTTDMIYISKTTSNKYVDGIVTDEPTSCCYMFQQNEMSSWTSYEKEKAVKAITIIGEFTSTVIYTLIWSNHNIYAATSYNDDKGEGITFDSDSMQFTVGTEVYFNKSIKFDGAWYPGIPVEVLETYPYVIIQKGTYESGEIGYTLRAANGPYIHIKREIIDSGIDNILLQIVVDEEGTVVIPVEANKTVTYSLSDEYIWEKLIESTTITPNPIGNAVGESNENLGYYELVWSNHNIYKAASYNYSTKEYTIGNEIYFDNSYLVITNNKYYSAIASRVRNTLGNNIQYKPSELPNAIIECAERKSEINSISKGIIYSSVNNVEFRGVDRVHPGICCNTDITTIEIPEEMVSIGACSFMNCYELTDVILPDSIISIGDRAFNNDYNLANINLPDNITSIGEHSFRYCSLINPDFLPDSLTAVGNSGFDNCHILTAPLPDGLISIGNRGFADTGYTELVIPASVKTIGLRAFGDNDNLTTVTFLGTPTSMGNYMFADCTNLKTINVPWSKNKFSGGWLYSNKPLNVTVNYDYVQPT